MNRGQWKGEIKTEYGKGFGSNGDLTNFSLFFSFFFFFSFSFFLTKLKV